MADRKHNYYFFFKDERTKRGDPPPIHFRIANLSSVKCKVHPLGVALRHFAAGDHTSIIPIDGTEVEQEVSRSVLLPLKWAAALVDLHQVPKEFLEFILEKNK